MANTAFTHDPTITVPGSGNTVNNRVVTWNGTTGKVFNNTALVTIDAGVVAGVTTLTASGAISGGTLVGTVTTATQNSITTMTALTTVGALNVGSITNGFTSIDVGSGAITTTGAISGATIAGDMRASVAQTTTGTSTALAVTPDGLAGSVHGEKVIQMVVVGFTTALTIANGQFYFHVPSTLDGYNIVKVHAECLTAPVGGNGIDIQLQNIDGTSGSGVDILSPLLTIDAGDKRSDQANTAAGFTGAVALEENDLIRVDIDRIGTSTAGSGLIVTMICRLP